ncbi:hypothetical protein [Kutzneria kofuensis]|uniref:Uncharacterized protein n=1 Tax=Kutzneria kofuensis TaxID=103725 RepID=A0A7W9NKY8_9PSEU|nr:hypothetical protein [Kutzneria kofuensis]MBB5897142.1 hypothetical protein [Kutzneria kofuensis]
MTSCAEYSERELLGVSVVFHDVRVVASPLRDRNGDTEGAILVLEENRA